MKIKPGKLLKPADIAAAAAVLLAAAVMYAASALNPGCTAQIIVDGELIDTIELSDVKEAYEVRPGNGTVILVEPGAIGFSDSDCANRLCVNTGKLTKSGQSAACLPNRTLIRITGRSRRSPDALTG